MRKKFFLFLKRLKWSVIVPLGRLFGLSADSIDRRTKLPQFLRELNARWARKEKTKTDVKSKDPRRTRNLGIGLRQSIKYFKQRGEFTEAEKALAQLSKIVRRGTVQSELNAIRGALRELDNKWLPRIPGTRPLRNVMNPHRICHLHKVSYPDENTGGAIRNLNIVKTQKSLGLDPFVILPLGYPATVRHEFELETIVAGVPHYSIKPFNWRKGRLARDRLLIFDTLFAAKLVASKSASIIHASSGYRGFDLALKGLALKKHFKIPLVYEVRSFHEHTWSTYFEGIMESEQTRLRLKQEERCIRESDHVVVISNAMRQVLINRGADPEKITLIPNGIDAERYRNRQSTHGEEIRAREGLLHAKTIGLVSNMSWREGHVIILRALQKLRSKHTDLFCLLVGDGPARKQLEKEAAALGIRDRVRFSGQIDNQEVDDYYEAIDIFVIPRRPDYAADYVAPLKPYEAMALRRPIIVSDRPVLKELVGDSRGLCFETDNVDDLVDKIEKLLEDQSIRSKITENAYDWVMNERPWNKLCRRYIDVYNAVLANHLSRDQVK